MDDTLCSLVAAIDGLEDSARAGRGPRGLGGVAGGGAEDPLADAIGTMMEVHVVGVSHHLTPVEVREKLAVPAAAWNQYCKELVEFATTPSGCVVPEAAVLSTCNRFELYVASPAAESSAAVEAVCAFLRQKSGLGREELDPCLFSHSGDAAVQHLFEVSSGLDSLVLGEAQILAQVKACYEHCIERPRGGGAPAAAGSGGKLVAKMLNSGIRTGKLVRTRTRIGEGSVSVSSAAVELVAARSMQDLGKHAASLRVCVLGAGKMGRLLLLALFSKYPDVHLTLINRSSDKARELLRGEVAARGGSNATVAPLGEMWDAIRQSDVVFTAAACEDPIITPSELRQLDRTLMLVDIAVPRNVAAGCGEVDGVTLYSVDDLKRVQEANAEKRKSEVVQAKQIIGEEVGKFKLWQASQGAVPYLAALQSMAENVRRAQVERVSSKLQGLAAAQTEHVDKLTRRIVDGLLRPIYSYMRSEEGDAAAKKSRILALKDMFGLEPEYRQRRPAPEEVVPAPTSTAAGAPATPTQTRAGWPDYRSGIGALSSRQ